MKTRKTNNWLTWKVLCEDNGYDPHETVEFGIDIGGGNSIDFEYTGDIPKKEEDHDEEWKNARDAYSGHREEE